MSVDDLLEGCDEALLRGKREGKGSGERHAARLEASMSTGS